MKTKFIEILILAFIVSSVKRMSGGESPPGEPFVIEKRVTVK